MLKRFDLLLVSFLVVFVVGFLGSIFTSGAVNSQWYLGNKPSFTPPNFIFPIVWTIIYFLVALSLYFSLIRAKARQRIMVFGIFGINLLANLLWSFFFFKLQNPLVAFIDLVMIFFTIFLIIFVTFRIDRKISLLLLPYLVWVAFAGVLNFWFII